jgi:hypothetical protein
MNNPAICVLPAPIPVDQAPQEHIHPEYPAHSLFVGPSADDPVFHAERLGKHRIVIQEHAFLLDLEDGGTAICVRCHPEEICQSIAM